MDTALRVLARLTGPPARLARVRRQAFERDDLVLAKLARTTDRDREDVLALARGPGLDSDLLRLRYRDELQAGTTNAVRLPLRRVVHVRDVASFGDTLARPGNRPKTIWVRIGPLSRHQGT